jgi:hypothetical protein
MKNAPAVTEASSRAAVGCMVARGGAAALTDNLRRAASGDAGSQHLMSAALRTATLRDDRYRRPLLDYTRSWRRYYALRAAERALSAVSWYTNRLEERTAGGTMHHA